MAMLLEAVESSYSPAFTNMQQDVQAGNDAGACERDWGSARARTLSHVMFLLLN